jgi:MYXO-CTERM domain-containing protein
MERHQGVGALAGLAAATVLGVVGSAGAVPLPPLELASSTLEVTCGGDTSSKTSTEDINTGSCERLVEHEQSSDYASSIAEAYRDSPEVFVQTYAYGAFSAIATSTLTARFRVDQIAEPPVATDVVDLAAFKSGEVSLSPSGSSFGTVRLSLDGPMHSDTTLALGPPDFENEKISVGVVPDESYTLTLRAQCQSASDGHCVAVLDPGIFFDQAAFDARLGASSYPLADYFSIEVSPNIGVPEPSAGALPALVLAGIAWRRRRRRPLSARSTSASSDGSLGTLGETSM